MTPELILTVLLTLPVPVMPGHDETPEARNGRLAEIAQVFAAEAPRLPGFSADAALALALATAYHESGFALDVDIGPCYRGKDGKNGRCDHGRAKCLFQLHARVWPDRTACVRVGVSAVRQSLRMCDHLPPRDRLAGLSGSCTRGAKGSREIFAIADNMRAKIARAKVAK